jgi:hypothetical protein
VGGICATALGSATTKGAALLGILAVDGVNDFVFARRYKRERAPIEWRGVPSKTRA